MNGDRFRKRRIAGDLEVPVKEANALAEQLGLEPYPVNYWIVDYDEMNELIAYGGFQHRYPHWRWGMQYDRQRKQGRYGGGKAFEIVNNDRPSHAFLQESNDLADQKAVITHVEAHADFFANNEWFGLFAEETPDAAAMLERHADKIQSYMQDPDIDRAEVEKWIDNALVLEDNIDQHRPFSKASLEEADREVPDDLDAKLEELGLSEEVRAQVFDREWLEGQTDEDGVVSFPPEPEPDLLAFLLAHGKQYDEDVGKAAEMDDWQRDVLEMLREEAYYFAPQKMTKVMNEGWASFWESKMMADEAFADADEFIDYADHQARVLGSPGLNPYKLGNELWTYVQNTTNRREVIERLLRVEGSSWRNLSDAIDFDVVLERLEPPDEIDEIHPDGLDALEEVDDQYVDYDALGRAREGEIDVGRYPWKLLTYEGMARRQYSLVKRQNRGFLASIGRAELERIGRYVFDTDRYSTIEDALDEVEFTAGWDRMREIRESHNDVTFLDEFLTQEFVDENDYFT
ncbi:MAG: stage V sporulation protein R, partial [Halobacteriales archaeon]